MSTKSTPADTSDREIVMTRVYDAPRELVWEAMTNPKHVAHWWGPRGFSDTTEIHDFRVGGVWKHMMHGPDGTNYPNKAIFKEIVAPERIVFSLGGGREQGPGTNFMATWTFEVVEGTKTRLTGRMVFSSSSERDFVAENFGAVEGGQQTLARLSEYLLKMDPSNPPFVVSREFAAPRELVWKAWTEREQLMQWFGPKGFTMPECKLDFKVGGSCLYCMRSADGQHEMWGKWCYREIVPPRKIVLMMSFSDAQGNIKPHPMAPTYPRVTLSTLTLTEANGKTTLTIEKVPLDASAEEIKMFNSSFDGMKTGWGGTFEQLDAHLKKQK